MHIGKRIAKLRKKRNIGQAELAKGIVSPSHLSNIEAGRYEPKEDTLILLANKLAVPITYLTDSDKNSYHVTEALVQLEDYIENDLKRAADSLDIFQREYEYIPSLFQELYYFLLVSYYYFKKGDIEMGMSTYYEDFSTLFEESFPTKLSEVGLEIYYYIRGTVSYHNRDFYASHSYFFQQMNLTKDEVKRAFIYNNMAMALFHIPHINEAINYASKAKTIFEQNKRWFDTADCLNLLGALYYEKKDLDHALKYYKHCLELSDKNGYSLTERVYHNLGLIYKEKGESAKSLHYFKKSLKAKRKSNSPTVTITLFAIVEHYIEQKENGLASESIDNVHLETLNESEKIQFDILRAKLQLLLGNTEFFEKTLENSLRYFKEKDDNKMVIKYGIYFSEYHQDRRRYKASNKYLSMVIEAYRKLERR